MRIPPWTVLSLLIVAGCAEKRPIQPTPAATVAPASSPKFEASIEREVARLRAALLQDVSHHTVDDTDGDRAWIIRAQVSINAAPIAINGTQLVVVVDRNPRVQELRIILARPDSPWEVIGGSKVSTGQAGRRGYFITPVGVFLHTDGILDYRALGTFNENHIRGLGLKGMRVWDFGWQIAEKGWHAERDMGEIRLLMHATDPDSVELRLGRPASQGCIRIPTTMNRFLDKYGVLDADYERAARDDPDIESVLLPERQPTPLAGNAMVIVDSSNADS
jgi:hypothetical protein